MTEKTPISQDFDSLSVFEFLWKWKGQIAIVCVAAALAAAFFSSPLFIKPKYRSSVIFYPSTTNSISKALLNNGGVEQDPLAFGAEEHAEQLIQILQSDVIREEIVEKFKLMKHYEIDESSPYRNALLIREYEDNIMFKRTEYMSVVIEVLDTDPKLAAEIANEIARLLDLTKNKIQKEKAEKSYSIVTQQYVQKQREIEKLNDSLNFFRSLGLFDYQLQTEYMTKELIQATAIESNETARLEVLRGSNISETDTGIINSRARLAGAKQTLKALGFKQEQLVKYGGAFNSVRAQLDEELVELNRLLNLYQKAKVDATEVLPVKFVVNFAKPAEKKAYPIRWLIVLLSTIGSFLLSIVVLVSLENYRFLKQKQILNA